MDLPRKFWVASRILEQSLQNCRDVFWRDWIGKFGSGVERYLVERGVHKKEKQLSKEYF